MGTSNSGGGPGDRVPLLPDWALPDSPGDSDADAAGAGDQADGTDGDTPDSSGVGGVDGASSDDSSAVATVNTSSDGNPTPAQPHPAVPPGAHWAAAKRRLGAAVSVGGRGRTAIARAGRAYVRARGGPRNAARTATSARISTARLGSFLSDASNRGVGRALESLGLSQLIGRDAHEVFAAILDALAPEGADLEQAATRIAIEQTLAGLFEQYVTPNGDVAALETMTSDDIRTAVEASVVASIFNRWLGDLERMIEVKAVSAAQAVRLERDVESYIETTLKLDLGDRDPLKMDWGGAEGTAFVERIYLEAYSILGGR